MTVDDPGTPLISHRFAHYRILAKIGSGGMGEVYRAHDERLGRDVAIKILRPSAFSEASAKDRLVQEARTASRLNHPHICIVHEVGEADGRAYIAMEWVEGQTLAARLAAGPLAPDDVLRVGLQLADALAHAHDRGIVHRDFKSANIVLTPEGRAKVLDFGLAKDLARAGEASTHTPITVSGAIVGTPAYMAPEQLRGEPLGPSSDVWSFGVVLYEMVAGVRPFQGGTHFELSAGILREPPRPLPDDTWPPLAAIIGRCLEKGLARRYRQARDVRRALEGVQSDVRIAASTGGFVEPGAHPSIWKVTVGTALVAAVVALGWSLFQDTRGPLRPPASPVGEAAPAPQRRSVAVLGFRNTSGRADAAWLSTAFSEMLTTELAAGEALRTVPGESVDRVRIELDLSDVDSYAPDTLSQIRRRLNADLLVFGLYVAVGEGTGATIRLDVRLQDSRAGETVAQVSESGPQGDLLGLVSRAGRRLRQTLGIEALTPTTAAEVRASQPATPEAARLYAEGLARLRGFDALAARDLLERAVAVDDRFPLAYSALAMAWSSLGYDERATSMSAKAFELSSGLSREERLSVEGGYRAIAKAWPQAIEIYQSLLRLFPDDIEYGLRLADAQVSSGTARDAMATIEAMRVRFAASDDPRIDLAEARAAEALSDFKRLQQAATAALVKGEAQGARLVIARASLHSGTAFLRTAQPDKAIELFTRSRDISLSVGDRGGVARALNSMATATTDYRDPAQGVRMYEEALKIGREIGDQVTVTNGLNNLAVQKRRAGDLKGSLALNNEALEIRRSIGDRSGVAVSLNNIGNVLLDLGDLAGAVTHYQESAQMARDIGDRRGLARALNNTAVATLAQGRLVEARRINEEALAIRREIADQPSVALSLHNIGEVLWWQGDLKGAERTLGEVLAIQRPLDARRSIGYALYVLGEALADAGRLEEARRAHQESLEIRTALGERVTTAESRLALAALRLEEGSVADAEAEARRALEVFENQKVPEDESRALVLIARARLAARRPVASRDIDRARAIVKDSQNVLVRLPVAIVSARVDGLASAPGRRVALESLGAYRTLAQTLGLVRLELEASLAMAEIERQESPQIAETRIAAAERDAGDRGLGLFARRAAALRTRTAP